MTDNQNTSAEQLKKGYDAISYITRYFQEHRSMPSNVQDFMDLPLEVIDPRTGNSRVVLIGSLTPQDFRDWGVNEEAASRDRYLSELSK